MNLVINGSTTIIDSNTANYIMNVGWDSITVSENIKTASSLVTAVERVLNPYINGKDYQDIKSSNFHFYHSILSATSGVEIINTVENKTITFKFNGTEATIWA
jgi:hypothetical protein